MTQPSLLLLHFTIAANIRWTRALASPCTRFSGSSSTFHRLPAIASSYSRRAKLSSSRPQSIGSIEDVCVELEKRVDGDRATPENQLPVEKSAASRVVVEKSGILGGACTMDTCAAANVPRFKITSPSTCSETGLEDDAQGMFPSELQADGFMEAGVAAIQKSVKEIDYCGTSSTSDCSDKLLRGIYPSVLQVEGCMQDGVTTFQKIVEEAGNNGTLSPKSQEQSTATFLPDCSSEYKFKERVTDQSVDALLLKKKLPRKKRGGFQEVMDFLESIGNLGSGCETQLKATDQSSHLESLTVVDLRKIMTKIGKPTAGCKEDLILELRNYISSSKAPGLLHDNVSFAEVKVVQISDEEQPVCFSLLECKKAHQMSKVEPTTFEASYGLSDSSQLHAVPSQEGEQGQVVDETGEKIAVTVCSIACPKRPLGSGTTSTVISREEQDEVKVGLLTGKTVPVDVERVQLVDRVYTRRRNRGTVATQSKVEAGSELTKPQSYKENEQVLVEHHVKDVSMSVQNIDITVQDQPSPELVTPPKKRRIVVKGPRPPEPEILTSVANQESQSLSNTQEAWTMLIHKKVQPGWVAYNPLTMRPSPAETDTKFMKLLSWNVNGLRALLRGDLQGNPMMQLMQRESFDILCLQETKLQEKDVEQIRESIFSGYKSSYWSCSVTKLGYSGTAILSQQQPISVRYGLGNKNHDSEGRLMTLEFDAFYLVAGYVPNSGQRLERLAYRTQEWDLSLSNYVKDLEKLKPVILTGDLNCAHQEIDIYNPDGNRKSAGFTDEERSSFEANFLKKGFVDSFRRQHPNAVAYTYWGYRGGSRPANKGWRLDYFLLSEAIADRVYDSYILPDILGSDHCPIGLILKS